MGEAVEDDFDAEFEVGVVVVVGGDVEHVGGEQAGDALGFDVGAPVAEQRAELAESAGELGAPRERFVIGNCAGGHLEQGNLVSGTAG
ncbi:hypothetical protein [Amycolatopsis sp. NPDC059657]|uniref:hypothetical protein n=1 Tax=Amycolatopsis sp. NPDC059657 TaxID=3346899 RepID=UPI0036721E7D